MNKRDPQEMSQAEVQQKLLEQVTESELERDLKSHAESIGWIRYHTLRPMGSNPGFPDDVLVRERVVWVECKTEKGKLTEYQEIWKGLLLLSGAEYYLCRPSTIAYVKQRLTIWSPYGFNDVEEEKRVSDLVERYNTAQMRAKLKKISRK